MTKDYSELFSLGAAGMPKPRTLSLLDKLGWQGFFAAQIDADELAQTPPVRVTEVHRSGLQVIGQDIDQMIPPNSDATVGDWMLLNNELPHRSRVLDRKSLFKRRAPGSDREMQLIAANIDTALIVTSCNADFNVARLERYIAVVFEADVSAVIVLTKSDLCEDQDDYLSKAQTISDRVPVIALDARGDEPAEALAAWCKPGQTIAVLGSSGVGKSTLVNALSGKAVMETQGIREDDAKGRHTTTHRALRVLPNGCAVIDTPGMRELQLTDTSSGIEDVFADITELAATCRFSDCLHETEPDCAVIMAIDGGQLDPSRLARWRKLAAEDRFNSASLVERRAADKAFGKKVRAIVKGKRK